MTTLVTGGTGFVGSNIIKTLASSGHEVVCFDLVEPDEMVSKFVEPWASHLTFVKGSILETDDLKRAVQDRTIDKVIHAAVFTATRQDIEAERSSSIVQINVLGTTNMLELARELSIKRFLYVSSASVYGESQGEEEILREDVKLYPHSLYSSTKYVSELLTRRYGELHSFSTVSVRLASPFGPMERVTDHRAVMSVLYECTSRAVKGEPIWVGDRDLGRDYTYVTDTAAGICAVLDAPTLSHEVYNITAGKRINLGDIVDVLQELRPGVVVQNDSAKVYGNLLPGYARGILDGSRMQDDLGYAPKYDLASGISDYIQWREAYNFLN